MKALLASILLLASQTTSAAELPPGTLSFFGALGESFRPESGRFGYGDWEFGVPTSKGVGVGRVFREMEGTTIVSFGLSANIIWTEKVSPGFYGSIGKEYRIFTFLRFRGEIAVSAHLNNINQAALLLGFMVHD